MEFIFGGKIVDRDCSSFLVTRDVGTATLWIAGISIDGVGAEGVV